MKDAFVVIGAGAIGLSCAYYLHREGVEVEVVERRHVGAGSSSGNAGWIVPSLAAPLPSPDKIPFALKSLVNPDSPFHVDLRAAFGMVGWLARFAARCNTADYERGLHQLASLAEPTMELYDALRADRVQFEMAAKGLLFAFLTRVAADREIASLEPMRQYGYDVADTALSYDAVHELAPALGDHVQHGLMVAGERYIKPTSLLAGLSQRLQEDGVRIQSHMEIAGFVHNGKHVEAVAAGSDRFDVRGVVIAAGAWSGLVAGKLGVRLPIQAGKGYSFSLALDGPMPTLPIYLGEAMIGCTPLGRSLRLAGTMDLSPVDDRFDRRRIEAMKRAGATYLPGGSWESTTEHWMGMRPLTPDGLPIIGRLEPFDNVFVATGHQMLGITLAPATGAALARMIGGDAVPELAPFASRRFA